MRRLSSPRQILDIRLTAQPDGVQDCHLERSSFPRGGGCEDADDKAVFFFAPGIRG